MNRTYDANTTITLMTVNERPCVDVGVKIVFKVTHWGLPAQLYGPPENCYEAEAPEIEIVKVESDVGGTWAAAPMWLIDLVEDWCTDNLEELVHDASEYEAGYDQ